MIEEELQGLLPINNCHNNKELWISPSLWVLSGYCVGTGDVQQADCRNAIPERSVATKRDQSEIPSQGL